MCAFSPLYITLSMFKHLILICNSNEKNVDKNLNMEHLKYKNKRSCHLFTEK